MAKRGRAKYNWPTMKQIYIMGKLNTETGENEDYTYTEIAAIFKVKTVSAVKKRADKEDWDIEREGQRRKDTEILKKKLQELRQEELPDIVTIRRQLLKGQLAVVTQGLARLTAGEMDIKPLDLHRASEFIIDQYYVLFGIEHDKPAAETEVNVKVDVDISGSSNDVLRRATRAIARRNTRPVDTDVEE